MRRGNSQPVSVTGSRIPAHIKDARANTQHRGPYIDTHPATRIFRHHTQARVHSERHERPHRDHKTGRLRTQCSGTRHLLEELCHFLESIDFPPLLVGADETCNPRTQLSRFPLARTSFPASLTLPINTLGAQSPLVWPPSCVRVSQREKKESVCVSRMITSA